MFIGSSEVKKAAAQQVIEAGTYLSKAENAFRVLEKVVSGTDLEFVLSARAKIAAIGDHLSEAFREDCRKAFIEDDSDGQ